MIRIDHQSTRKPPPLLSSEFADVSRLALVDDDRFVAKIAPGQFYASARGEFLMTTLGSCVAACIRNPQTGIGGMNHFMLPDYWEGGSDWWESTLVSSPARYGNVAMERLINVVLADRPTRSSLEIKVFGGAKVLRANIDIGERNITFVKSYLRTEGLTLDAQDLGGTSPRRLIYDSRSGEVFVRRLASLDQREEIVVEELAHLNHLRQEPVSGDVDLFDAGDNS